MNPESFYDKVFSNGGIHMLKISFIGAGRMTQSFLQGLSVSDDFLNWDIMLSNRSFSKLETLQTLYPIRITQDNRECVRDADIVILAVKPQQLQDVIVEIRDEIQEHTLIISLAAAITLDQLSAWFNKPVKLIRFMPNTAVAIHLGSIAVCPSPIVSETEIQEILRLFKPLGSLYRLDENLIDAFIAASGSGIAFVYFLIDIFTKNAIAKGLPENDAKVLCLETFQAAVSMAKSQDLELSDLIDQVCSKGGTTIEGIKTLQASDLEVILNTTFEATMNRSKELSELLNR